MKKREKEQKKILTMAVVGPDPQTLSNNLNVNISKLIESGYEIISVNGYNIAYIKTGPYQEFVQYSSLIIYQEK